MGSRCAQHRPHSPTWPNLGPRCAPDSLFAQHRATRTSFRHHQGPVYAPDSLTCTRPSPTQTQVGRRPAVRRKPLNPGAGHEARALPGGPSVVTEGYRRSGPLPPTLVPKTGGPRRHYRVTDAPVIYSVSCV